MTAIKIGYARCSTDRQDLTAQRAALAELGVTEDRIYTDHGLTGNLDHERPSRHRTPVQNTRPVHNVGYLCSAPVESCCTKPFGFGQNYELGTNPRT
jgi:hypothetical protein